MIKKNIKLIIEYDGTRYAGWQSQINATGIQDIIKKSVLEITQEETNITGASRTDSGVHALGQVANFNTSSSIPAEKFFLALNPILPDDILIKKSSEVPNDFHARYWAKEKKYRYLINNSSIHSVFLKNRACHVLKVLDINKMERALEQFIGTHDFSGFMASKSNVKNTIREIKKVSLMKNKDVIKIEIAGNGFLYKMVRIIVGTLIEVGLGKISTKDIPSIIESKDRKRAGKTAPACGLYLVEVRY